jgi:hypothetical protein
MNLITRGFFMTHIIPTEILALSVPLLCCHMLILSTPVAALYDALLAL